MAGHKGPLRVAIEDFLGTFNLRDLLRKWVGEGAEDAEGALVEALSDFWDEIDRTPGMPDWLRRSMPEKFLANKQAGAAVAASAAMGLGMTAASGLMAPLSKLLNYQIDNWVHSARADPATAIATAWRQHYSINRVFEHTRDLGWTDEFVRDIQETLRPRADEMSLITLWLRDQLDEYDLDMELGNRGYEKEGIAQLKKLARLLPGPGDLISMAVREAFDPAIIDKYGYAENFPPEFAEWMQKQGDKDNWAMKYWVAHWRMPGLDQALTSLYRLDDFGMTELDEYLRVADIAPAWRDYIKRTAYRTLTRVDIRRMYGAGVLGVEDVKRKYLDFGYDDEDAEAMTAFTVKFEGASEREASRADILSGLTLGMLSGTEALEWLQEIGYPEELAVYYVTREITKIERKKADKQATYLHNLYIHGELTPSEASSRLAAAGFSAGEIEAKLTEWDIDRQAKAKRPPQGTLDKFFKSDVITEAQYTDGLSKLGYQADYVDWYLAEILQAKAETARREEEKARDEQERIRTRKVKSDYQVAKARLDVDIAEITTAISETQLALRERQLRYSNELRLAREALSEIELRSQAEIDIAASEAEIKQRQSVIAYLREQVEGIQTEVAEIKLRATPAVGELSTEEAKRLVAEKTLAIEHIQDEIATAETDIALLRQDIHERQTKLETDLGIVARLRTTEEIETSWRVDQVEMTRRLTELRTNLAALREQKASLTVEYRVGLVA